MAITSARKPDQLKLLGIWLPPEERWQMKVAAAARRMTLNQAVRQAMQEWIARSGAASATTQISAPQPGANPRREPAAAKATVVAPQATAAASATVSAKPTQHAASGAVSTNPSQPAAKPEARLPASAPTRKAGPGQAAAAPARAGPPFAWLRGAAGLEWSACPAVESRAAPDGSRVWVFRGTHITLKKIFRLLQEGHASAKVGRRFNLDPQLFEEVLRFAAQRLAPFLPGAG